MSPPTFPTGYSAIPAGNFHGKHISAFGFKQTPVTNAEYGDLATNRKGDRFVLLHHDWNTGNTRLVKTGQTATEVVKGPVLNAEVLEFDKEGFPFMNSVDINFDQGDIMIFGTAILVKMVDNPSAKYDKQKKVFSGANQPAVGLTYFHAKAWCLLKTLESHGKFSYNLPTDARYEYVASDRGTKEYGTETGTLSSNGRKLAHLDEYNDDSGMTTAVDDPRYAQNLPFGVQTTGNIRRWINFNSKFRQPNDFFNGPYGLRGGSWADEPDNGRTVHREDERPNGRFDAVGFSPIVMRRMSIM